MNQVSLENLVLFDESKPTPIVANVSVPKQTADGDWLCIVEVRGLDNSGLYRAFGVDGVQAMRLGISILVDLIEASSEWQRGEVFLRGDDGFVEKLDYGVLSTLK